MYFCPKCHCIYNITRSKREITNGENKVDVIFRKYPAEEIEEADLEGLVGEDITNDERFDTMTKNVQRKFMTNIKAIDKNFFLRKSEDKVSSTDMAFFECKFCHYYTPIKPGTCIYTKTIGGGLVAEDENYDFIVHDQTLPRTCNYICPNDHCPTHKDESRKEAILTKNEKRQIVHVCTVCLNHWNI